MWFAAPIIIWSWGGGITLNTVASGSLTVISIFWGMIITWSVIQFCTVRSNHLNAVVEVTHGFRIWSCLSVSLLVSYDIYFRVVQLLVIKSKVTGLSWKKRFSIFLASSSLFLRRRHRHIFHCDLVAKLINRPGIAWAVLQSPPSLIHLLDPIGSVDIR